MVGEGEWRIGEFSCRWAPRRRPSELGLRIEAAIDAVRKLTASYENSRNRCAGPTRPRAKPSACLCDAEPAPDSAHARHWAAGHILSVTE